MRRLPGREEGECVGQERRCAGAQRPMAGHISSYTSCEVRPIEMLAAPRNRITTSKVAHSGLKYHRRGREYFATRIDRSTSIVHFDRYGLCGVLARAVASTCVMRMSELFLRTLRDDPADADVDSHRLLLRAGFIRRVSAGIYSWLPARRRGCCARSPRSSARRWTGPAPRRSRSRSCSRSSCGSAPVATPSTAT